MTLSHHVLQHSAKRVAVLISLLAASPLAAQAQVAFSLPQNVSSNPGASYGPLTAVDSKGGINIVWTDYTPGYYAVFFSRSSDGGATFSAPQNLSNAPAGSSGPQIAVDSSDNINVIWSDYTPGYYADVFFSRSTDGGSTFSAPVQVSGGSGARGTSMALDTAGNIYIAWAEYWTSAGGSYGMFIRQSSDGGATFSSPIAVSTSLTSSGPQVAIDSAGNINVAWVGYQCCYVVFSRSSDGGATFTAPKVISYTSEDLGFRMTLDSKGNIYAVLDSQPSDTIDLSHSSDGGATFSYTNITNDGYATPRAPQIATDSSGNINVVWQDDTPGNDDIFFSRSSDGGATFSTPQNLSNDPGASDTPQIVVDSSGNINVVWQDNTPGNSVIFYTRSSDGGATFSTPQNLSNDPGDSAGPQIVVDSSGNINVAWADNTPGNYDIFFTRSISLSALSLSPSTVTGGSSSMGTVTLSAPAPPGGAVISLSSSDPTVASVPDSVTVSEGTTSASFTVSTSAVGSSTSVTISGSYNGTTQSASLTVTPPTLTSLTLSPSSVLGGPLGFSTGTVTFSAPAPAGGVQVMLSSSDPSAASVPSSVTVPAGATGATFTVSTSIVIVFSSVTISGSYNSTTQSASLAVLL
jgi:BNR repeat-like domain